MNIWGRRARRFPLCFVMNFVVFADSGAAARGLPPTVIQMDFSRYYRWSWFNLSPRSPGRVCLGSWHRGRGVPQWGLCLGDAAILGTAQGAGQGWCGPFSRGGRGQGPPRHPRRRGGLCATHPGDTVTIETAAGAGWEGRRMWQPPNPPGAGGTVPKKTTRGCSCQPGGCTPHHAHPLVTLVWAGQHPSAPSPAPAGTPWNLPCPHLGVTGSVSHPDCARLCPPGQPDPARQLCYLGHRPKNLKDCLDLLNVAAFVCFLPSVFQILRFLPSVLQIFRV